MTPPTALVAGHGDDFIAGRVESALRAGGADVLAVPPGNLAGASMTIAGERLVLDGVPIAGALLRAGPFGSFSDEYRPEDRPFCDAEFRAVWLAAMHLDSLLAVNRYDATSWLQGFGWSRFRSGLIQAGIPVSSLAFGGDEAVDDPSWLPYHADSLRPAPGPATRRAMGCALAHGNGEERHLAVWGRLVTHGPESARQTAVYLDQHGIRLAAITTDRMERVLRINPEPALLDSEPARQVAAAVTEGLLAHLRRW